MRVLTGHDWYISTNYCPAMQLFPPLVHILLLTCSGSGFLLHLSFQNFFFKCMNQTYCLFLEFLSSLVFTSLHCYSFCWDSQIHFYTFLPRDMHKSDLISSLLSFHTFFSVLQNCTVWLYILVFSNWISKPVSVAPNFSVNLLSSFLSILFFSFFLHPSFVPPPTHLFFPQIMNELN